MSAPVKKVTVNLPADLLENAKRMTGQGITETLIEGLQELERRGKRRALQRLRGSVNFELNLRKTRK